MCDALLLRKLLTAVRPYDLSGELLRELLRLRGRVATAALQLQLR